VDTKQQGSKVKATLKNLALARSAKGPMSSKNLSYTIRDVKKGFDLNKAITTAIKNNAKDFLNPPITNIGYKGILKASGEIKKWFKNSRNIERDFKTTAMLMERAGTGGALFRNLYRDFLKESYGIIQKEQAKDAAQLFSETAILWTKVASLFDKAGDTKKVDHINQAAEILVEISSKEKLAMEALLFI
jgi:hypothetical protein